MIRLRNRSRIGRPVSGGVCFVGMESVAPGTVKWPGHYATKINRDGHEVPDRKAPVVWDETDRVFRYA